MKTLVQNTDQTLYDSLIFNDLAYFDPKILK